MIRKRNNNKLMIFFFQRPWEDYHQPLGVFFATVLKTVLLTFLFVKIGRNFVNKSCRY